MSIDMKQFQVIFMEEAQEHLEELEQLLMEFDVEQPDPEALNSIFRAAHSIKGGSGMFGFDALASVTHVMENLLDRARQGELRLTIPLVDRLLSTTDTLKAILQCYRDDASIDWNQVAQATDALEQVLDGPGAQDSAKEDEQGFGLFKQPVQAEQGEAFGFFDAPGEPADIRGQTDSDDGFGFFDSPEATADAAEDEGFGFFDPPEQQAQPPEDDGFGFFAPLEPTTGSPVASKAATTDPVTAEPASERTSPAPLGSHSNVAQAPNRLGSAAKPPTAEATTIRVDTQKIDLLVNLAGELVITQSMLNTIARDVEGDISERLEMALLEMERNTREMQEAVMSIRMLPVSFVFNRFPRLVRDLCTKLGKKAELVIEGAHTEIDKGLVEKLVDPLTHLVRNSLDHGIEKPELRSERGKPETGTLLLKAEQKGGNIIIKVQDDGGGLNREKILQKASQNNIPLPESPTDSQVWHCIFAAGFSTADQVTDVSGRGVGMDVVRRNIESLGGQIEIESTPGKGSVFSIRLPLTLAIVDGMCISAGDQIFVIPLVSIIESIQPDPSQIKTLTNDRLLWVREEYWPIVDLREAMGIPPQQQEDSRSSGVVVLLESSRQRFGLLVDDLVGQQQVVIKSLEQHYKRVSGVAGATIMGDGRVALILDVESLAGSVQFG